MSASYGNQGNWGGASGIGGGGNMSQQEMRGTGGLLGMMSGGVGGGMRMGRAVTAGIGQSSGNNIDEAQLRRMLEEMGINIDDLNGGASQPSTQPASWSFPQYSQGWLPPPPPVPPMVPTPPFKRK